MATQPSLVETETNTDLIVVEAQRNAVALFTNEKQYDEFYERVRESVSGFTADVTTDKGRREIACVAFRVTKAKTTLDKAGFALTEEWRQKTNAVNAARRKMTTQLDALADEVRRPLTQWEEQEAARQERVDREIAYFRGQSAVAEEETSADVDRRLAALNGYMIDPALYGVREQEAVDAKEAAVQALQRAAARLRQEEADRAELDRLRRESAEREEADRIQREAREREETERRVREEEDRRRVEAEDRRKAEIAAAEERARVEAQEKERLAAEERLAEERRAREAAEREADEAHQREQERLAWEAKEKRDREAREADERHRRNVIEEVRQDIETVLGNEPVDYATAIATALAAGTIRNVRVAF